MLMRASTSSTSTEHTRGTLPRAHPKKFFDLMEAHNSPIATEMVERIAPLYEIENQIRGRSPDERREVRNTKARPLLESMHAWLESCLSKLSRKSDTSAAIHYALARWDAFARYCDAWPHRDR